MKASKKQAKKNANNHPPPPSSSEESETSSNSQPESPVQSSVQRKEKKEKGDKGKVLPDDDHHLDLDYHQASGHFHELIVNFACLLLSIWMVYLCPVPEVDLKKQPGISFMSLYFQGLLDRIEHISQMLLAAGFSLFLDFFVVGFHVLYPPHPKFVLVVKRKISIYIHLIAGITEITTGVLAFCVADDDLHRLFSQIMSAASIAHGMTAYFQTGVVFGAKGIMVPGYIYAITLHVTNAYRLYNDPTSVVYLLYTFLLLHIYVWCRFFIFFFRTCKMFDGYHYTVSITLSGLLLFPFAVGPIGNFGMLFVVVAFCVLESLLSHKTGRHLHEKLFREHERYALITQKQLDDWRNELHRGADAAEDFDRKAAQAVFDKLHENHEEELRPVEIYSMLKQLAIPSITVRKLMELADVNKDGFITFDEFYRYIWSIGDVHTRIKKASLTDRSPVILTPRDKAKLVFEMIDIDDSGFVGVAELDLLLTQWGMPYMESTHFIRKYAGAKHKLSFEEFYKNLKPIWDFAATYVYN